MLQPCSFSYNNKDIIYIMDDIYFMNDDGVKVLNDFGMEMVLDCSNELLKNFFTEEYNSKLFYEWGWKYNRIMLSDFCFPDIREIVTCIIRNYLREIYPNMDEDLFLINHAEDIVKISSYYIKNNSYISKIEKNLSDEEIITNEPYCKMGMSYFNRMKNRGKNNGR